MSTELKQQKKRQKAMALAALFQAVAIADSLAWQGQADASTLKTSLESIFDFEQQKLHSLETPANWKLGLMTLEGCLVMGASNTHARMADRLRYALGLLHLERQLHRSSALLDTYTQRVKQAERQQAFFQDGLTGSGMLHKLAGIYVDTLGQCHFRLQIKGNEQRLKTVGVPEQIRSSLLAGIAAARLWHSLGGRRWHLMFIRRSLIEEVRHIVQEERIKKAITPSNRIA